MILVNRFLSSASERVSSKTINKTFVVSSDNSSPKFSLAWLKDWESYLETEPIMESSSGLFVVTSEDDEVSWWDRKEPAKLVSMIGLMNSDPVLSIILFIFFPKIWINRTFLVSGVPCQLIGIMWGNQLSNCLCLLIGLLHLTLSWHSAKLLLKRWTLPYYFWWYSRLREN